MSQFPKKTSFFLAIILVTALGCKVPWPPPAIEKCIHNADNTAECADLRKPKEAQSYTRTDLVNYICTSPKDEEKLYNYCANLRQKLIECERK